MTSPYPDLKVALVVRDSEKVVRIITDRVAVIFADKSVKALLASNRVKAVIHVAERVANELIEVARELPDQYGALEFLDTLTMEGVIPAIISRHATPVAGVKNVPDVVTRLLKEEAPQGGGPGADLARLVIEASADLLARPAIAESAARDRDHTVALVTALIYRDLSAAANSGEVHNPALARELLASITPTIPMIVGRQVDVLRECLAKT